jgi:hypothetical protein
MLTLLGSAAVLAFVTDSGGPYDVQVANKTEASANVTLAPGGAIVRYIGDSHTTLGSSGTGTFTPFIRLQGSPTEAGYNTDGTLEFESKSGTWTHSMKVSGIPIVVGPDGTTLYWELWVDINETNSAKHVSLNDVEVYFDTIANGTGYPNLGEQKYDFEGSILINDVNQGSGRGDLRYLIPIAQMGIPPECTYNPASTTCNTYFILYSNWGTTSADFNSDGGFEEWKVKIYPVPPTLKLVKSVVNDNGGSATSGDWSLAATGTSASFTDLGSSTTFHVVTAGVQYALSESPNPGTGYSTTGIWSCTGGGSFVSPDKIALAAAEQVTCTITNNDNPPSLTLNKVVVNDNGGTRPESDWNLTATGALGSPTNLSGPGAAGSADVTSGATFKADTYTLAETGTYAGYTNGTTYSCVKTPAGGSAGAPVVSNSITLANGDSAICTITNNDDSASPTIRTAQGWTLSDTAHFTGILHGASDEASTTVTFRLYGPSATPVCNAGNLRDTQTVTGAIGAGGSVAIPAGVVVTPATSPATYYWVVDYSGDQFNNSSTSACGTETTTISFVQPAP